MQSSRLGINFIFLTSIDEASILTSFPSEALSKSHNNFIPSMTPT